MVVTHRMILPKNRSCFYMLCQLYLQIIADWHTDVINARTNWLEAICAFSKLAWKKNGKKKKKTFLTHGSFTLNNILVWKTTLRNHTPQPNHWSAGCRPCPPGVCPAVWWAPPHLRPSYRLPLTPSPLPRWTPLSNVWNKEKLRNSLSVEPVRLVI